MNIARLILVLVYAVGCSNETNGELPTRDSRSDTSLIDSGVADVEPSQCASPNEQTCVVGTMFADCGSGSPAVWCSSGEAGRCVWVSNGCPARDFVHRGYPDECRCADNDCPPSLTHFFYAFGAEPWLRNSFTNVQVEVDVTANPENSIGASCFGAVSLDCSRPSICCTETVGPGGGPVVLISSQTQFDTHVLSVRAANAFAGWELILEIDHGVDPLTGRICRVPYSDNPTCIYDGVARECATSGTINLQSLPSGGASDIHGTFDSKFPSGLSISGSF